MMARLQRVLVANRVQPGKRPRSSMAPVMAFDSESRLVDLGRGKRFFDRHQRLAMSIQQDGTCAVERCPRPTTCCEAAHLRAWAAGGRTDLADGALLCKRHHTLADHPDYRIQRLRPGRIAIHRRC